jgi:tetratricopeptide (TPR) repeat protein
MTERKRHFFIALFFFSAACFVSPYLAQSQESSRELLQKAESLHSARKYAEALGVYEKLIAADPSCAEAYRGIVTCYSDLGNPQGAVKYMDGLFLEHPQRAEVCYGLGVALYTAGKYDNAATYFQQAVKLKPDLAAAWNNSAVIYHFIKRDYAAARQYYEKAIDISTRTGNAGVLDIARKNLANLPREEDLKPLTLEEFLNTFIARAESRDETGVRQLVLSQKENSEQAVDWLLGTALRACAAGRQDEEKTSADLAQLLAAAYAAAHKSDRLQKKYDEYAGLDPEQKKTVARGEALLAGGMDLEQQGRYDEAVQQYLQALACFERSGRKKSSGLAHLYLGDAYRAAKNFRQAQASYSNALTGFMELRDEPRKALALSSLGITCALLDNNADALDFLKRSLTIYTALKDDAAAGRVRQNIERVEAALRDKKQAKGK